MLRTSILKKGEGHKNACLSSFGKSSSHTTDLLLLISRPNSQPRNKVWVTQPEGMGQEFLCPAGVYTRPSGAELKDSEFSQGPWNSKCNFLAGAQTPISSFTVSPASSTNPVLSHSPSPFPYSHLVMPLARVDAGPAPPCSAAPGLGRTCGHCFCLSPQAGRKLAGPSLSSGQGWRRGRAQPWSVRGLGGISPKHRTRDGER